jgi:hypothetical protein
MFIRGLFRGIFKTISKAIYRAVVKSALCCKGFGLGFLSGLGEALEKEACI